ncbi:MAG TPA: hypothetical protein VGC99_23410 [Candidatus Tectomicrobia bacterium]
MILHLQPCDLHGPARGETLDDAVLPPGLGGGAIRLARRLPTTALGIDLAGRRISGIASGLLDAPA